jgi:hypothetical protein
MVNSVYRRLAPMRALIEQASQITREGACVGLLPIRSTWTCASNVYGWCRTISALPYREVSKPRGLRAKGVLSRRAFHF